MKNNYFVCRPSGNGEFGLESWNAEREDSMEDLNGRFWGQVVKAMEARAEPSLPSLRVFMTWNLNELPAYGQDVVAVVFGDESGSAPLYSNQVRAVFKTHGVMPQLERPLSELTSLAVWSHLRVARNAAKIALSSLREETFLKGRVVRNLHEVPCGLGNMADVPIVDFWDREVDAYFGGSVQNQSHGARSWQKYVRPPKEIARNAMVNGLKELEGENRWAIKVGLTSNFRVSTSSDPVAYSAALMNAKICLAPRGTTVETYRVFEGLKSGCIVFSDPLPRRWYFAGLPIVEVKDWNRVGRQIEQTLEDRFAANALHRRSLSFWQDIVSEVRVGEFLASKL